MPFIAVQNCVFSPSGAIVQSSPPVPTEVWFTINTKPIVVTGDTGSWVGPGPSSGPAVVAGTSHWLVNGKPMARIGIDTAPPLSVLSLTGQGADYFSA